MPDLKEAKIVKGKDGKLRLENFYTPLSEAKKEIWRRWNDKALRKKVEEFLGGDVPEFLGKDPRAVIVRYVISPDIELNHFFDLAKEAKLNPACVEFADDKFVAGNSDKYHLCKLFFHNGNGKNGGHKISTQRIVDFNKLEGKKFNKMKTLWGEEFIRFHHNLVNNTVPAAKNKMFDFSKWFERNTKSSKYYYIKYLALFLCHGILFENFLTNEEEIEFTEKKVLPCFNNIEQAFGLKPLIVPLTPISDENNLYWWCYPEHTKKFMRFMVVLK
jgi:hypothetical protein